MAAIDESVRAAPRRAGRSGRRHRPLALLIATFGWIVQILGALLVAARDEHAPLVLGASGALLLGLTLTRKGDVPFAAIGVAAVGAIATGLGALAAVASPLFATASASVSALGPLAALLIAAVVLLVPSIGALSYALSPRLLRGLVGVGALAIVLGAVVTFPSIDRGAVYRTDTQRPPSATTSSSEDLEAAPPRGLMGALVSRRRPEQGVEGLAAPPREAEPERARDRAPAIGRPRMPLGFACIWLVGLALALAGALDVRRTLARLSQLEHALPASRVGDGFALEDGRLLSLDREPGEDRALVVAEGGAPAYRTGARTPAVLVGSGPLDEQRDALRRRIATTVLALVLTSAMSWLPLLVLRLNGWAIVPVW